jgi:hypothetical protein
MNRLLDRLYRLSGIGNRAKGTSRSVPGVGLRSYRLAAGDTVSLENSACAITLPARLRSFTIKEKHQGQIATAESEELRDSLFF